MLICHCRGISDRQIRRAVRAGAVTADQVSQACGAGGGCGGCMGAVEEVLQSELQVSVSQPARLELHLAPAR